MLRNFLASAGKLISLYQNIAALHRPGEVYVTLANGQGGTEIDGEARREWGNCWQAVCRAGDVGMVLRGAFAFDASAWSAFGYAPRGRSSRGTGEFHVQRSVTHVFCPEKCGIVGVCSPSWRHDIGLWCSPYINNFVGNDGLTRSAESAVLSSSSEVRTTNDGSTTKFDEKALLALIIDFLGTDLIDTMDGVQPAIELLREEAQSELRLPDATTAFERRRQQFTHRRTYRIIYRASSDRALSRERTTKIQLDLRKAIQQSDLPLLLT